MNRMRETSCVQTRKWYSINVLWDATNKLPVVCNNHQFHAVNTILNATELPHQEVQDLLNWDAEAFTFPSLRTISELTRTLIFKTIIQLSQFVNMSRTA
jgi:hypothetical protein